MISGETIVTTVNGSFPIRELAGDIWILSSGQGYARRCWRMARFKSCEVGSLKEVTFEDGQVIYATPGHQWVVVGNHGGLSREIKLKNRVKTIDLTGECVWQEEGLGRDTWTDRKLKVVSVNSTDRIEDVYCCSEIETNTMTIGNGILTGDIA